MSNPIGRQTITILDAPLVTGPYNESTRDWTAATQTLVGRVTCDYTGSTEVQNAGDQTTTTARLFLPPRAPRINEWMRVVWQGRTWEVHGVPADPEQAGLLSGQVVDLREVAG